MRFEESRFDRFFSRINTTNIQEKFEIAIEEYKVSAGIVSKKTEEFNRVIQFFLTLFSGIIALITYTLLQKSPEILNLFQNFIFSIFIISLLNLFSLFLIIYTASNLKDIYYHSLKMVIIRKNLGLSYGIFTPLISDDSYIGGDDPFKIRLFPNWITYESIFILILSLINSFTATKVLEQHFNNPEYIFTLHFLMIIFIYRYFTLEKIETPTMIFLHFIFNTIFNLKLEDNFSWPLYRAKLNANEIVRLKINKEILYPMIIFIEDKDFQKHIGISFRSFIRILYFKLIKKRTIGGSTISQQLFRSLFVIQYSKTKRRKIAEIFFTPLWLERKLSKRDILDLYISSVRFEKEVIGLPSALNYFFPQTKKMSQAQSFFLIERIGNIRSTLLPKRIYQLAFGLLKSNLLTKSDIVELIDIYKMQIRDKKIIATNNSFELLHKNLNLLINHD